MIGIIGAMEEEVLILREALEKKERQVLGGCEFTSGELAGRAVVLLKCGIGKVNAAVGCALLIEKYKPDFVLNTGSAGGIDRALRIGDVVLSTGLVEHDVDVTAFSYKPGQVPGMPQVFPADSALIAKAEAAVTKLKQAGELPADFRSLQGLIGSGDVFMHEQARIDAVKALFPEMSAVDMEAAAIAHACWLFQTPCLIIRALSDIAGTESPITHDQFLKIASKHSALIVRGLVQL